MKPQLNPFVTRIAVLGTSLVLGISARADMFDLNGTTDGFGVADAGLYDWWTANVWAGTPNDTGTAATATWVNGSRQAYFVGAGTGTSYTVRLGPSGSTATTFQNTALNVNSAASGQLAGSEGNVTIGEGGDTGVLSMNASNSLGSYGGTLTVNNPINMGAGRQINFRGGNVVLNGVISGTGTSRVLFGSGAFGLTSGTLTLANTANTYAGRTNADYINSGYTLAVTKLADGGSNSSIGTSSANIGINGGTLKYIGNTGAQSSTLGFNVASGGVFMDASGVTSADTISFSGTPTYSAANAARTINLTGTNTGDNTLAFAYGNNGSGLNILTKGGTGKWVLTQANGYTGGTNITGGILSLSGSGTTGATTGTVTLGGGQLDLAGLTRTVGAVSITTAYASGNTITSGTLTGSSYAASNATGDAVVAAALQGSAALTKSGAGTLTLTGLNTFTGNVTVSAGNLVINNSDALGTSATTKTVTITASANKFIDLDSSISGGSDITLSNKINFTTSGINGVFRNIAGNNTIQGTITMAVGNGDSKIISNGGTLTLAGTITANTSIRVLDLSGSSLGDNTVSGVINNSNTPSLRKSDVGKWILTNSNTFAGPTLVTGGTLVLQNNLAIQSSAFDTSGAGTLDLTDASINTLTIGGLIGDSVTGQDFVLPGNVTSLTLNPGGTFSYAKNLSGGAAGLTLTKSGAGTQVLSGTNTYSGLTTINAGSLLISNTSAIGGTHITMSGTGNSALVLTDGVTAGSGKTLEISGGGVGGFFGALTNPTGSTDTSEWQGNVTIIAATGTRIGAQGGTLRVSGNIGESVAGNQLIVRNNGGKTILSGTNNHTGETLLNAVGGELQIEGGSAIHDSGLVNITNSVGNIFRVSASETIGALAGGGNTTAKAVIEAGQTLTLSSGTQTFAGVIEGSGDLTVDGALQTLTGSNSYSGTTTVTSGTLLVNTPGSLDAASAVSVTGGTLGGTGTIQGSITLASGAVLAPGASIGTLTSTGGTTLVSGSTFAVQINTDSTTADHLAVSGTLDLGGSTLALSNLGTTTPIGGAKFTIASYTTLTGTFAGYADGATVTVGSIEFTLDYNDDATPDTITLTAIASETPFDAWATKKGLTDGVNDAPGDDPDGDGRNNFEEFAFDGHPLDGANDGKIVGKVATVDNNSVFTYTLPVRVGATFSGTTEQVSIEIDGVIYTVQGSDDLGIWNLAITEVTGDDAALIQSGLPGLSDIDENTVPEWQYHTFRTPGTVTGDPSDFIRAKVEPTP